jgi:peptidoglycan/LPS O-acetylase OafA/YrhL
MANQQAQPGIVTISGAVNQKHYPSLNGLRGISIIMVVMAHLRLSNHPAYMTFFNGFLGVNIFFVLSGFLITTLCIKEKNLTGTLSLKQFYIRRILRIFPVAYLFLAVLAILNFFFHLQVAGIQFFGAFFYLVNFTYFKSHDWSWFTAHYWSLSVEEQFYIIFPFILKIRFKVFFYAILFLVFVLPVLCTLQEFFPVLNKGFFYFFTRYFIKFQSIAVGCLFSILAFRKSFDSKYFQYGKTAGNLVAFFLIYYLLYEELYSIKAVYLNLLVSCLIGYIVVTNLSASGNVVYRVLNWKWLSFIGILSYSIYIWQELFTPDGSNLPTFLTTFPTNVIFIIIVPLMSYFWYEKHFLKLKSKFSKLKKNE